MNGSMETNQNPTITTADPERKSDDTREIGVGDEPERKKQKKDEEEPIISGYYNHDDSDITLASSDHVYFKVHTYLLRRVS
jgi:hypothetical protein